MQEIDKILTKILLEEPLTVSEKEMLLSWEKDTKNNPLVLKQIKDYWEHQKSTNTKEKDRVWQDIEEKTQMPKKSQGTFISFKKLFRVAAILLVVLSIWSIINYQTSLRENQVEKTLSSSLIIKENGRGEKRTIKLPDGSVIKLNSESKLIFPQTFGPSNRVVELEGEAFFDVAEDSLRPFIIRSGDIITTVKGTSFNISAYKIDKKIAVSVVTGRVEVKSDKQVFDLIPGEKVEYKTEEKEASKSSFDTKEIAWREGILVFNGDNMEEIISKLERWYNVSITVQGERVFGIHDFKGEYKNKSLENILENVSFAGGFNYSIDEKNVILY